MVEVTASDKHSRLLCYTTNYSHEELYDAANSTLSIILYSNGKLWALPDNIRKMVEVTASDKHSRLLCYAINYSCTELYDASNGILLIILYSNV